MVKGWAADITPLYDKKIYKNYFDRIPGFRKDKAMAQTVLQKRIQSVAAWVLWEKIKAEYGVTDDAVFNLSHSGKFVMCAVCIGRKRVQVGCDIQQIGEMRERVAKRFFCPTEYAAVMEGKTEAEQRDTFYRYWVLKESFLKATRMGMNIPLDSFEIRLGNPPVLVRKPNLFQEEYYYREYQLPGIAYKMAICSTQEEIADDLDMRLKL